MKITLAWPQEGIGDAGQTVDVDDATAQRLLHDGYARLPDDKRSHGARDEKKEG